MNERVCFDMKQRKSLFSKAIIGEFLKYVVVGGVAFLVDAGVLSLCFYIFLDHVDVRFWGSFDLRTVLATAIGFAAGLIANYILSTIFVFNKETQKNGMGKTRAFLIYAVVGVIGLILTELGMALGETVLGIHYDSLMMLVKIVVAGIVLIWNYLGRKIFVYKWA